MRILNRRVDGLPEGSVYVGRPGKWGNPFPRGKGRTREQAIAEHAEWIKTQPQLMRDLYQLKGKDLVCWCYPEPCHAETLMRMANPGWEPDQIPF